MGMCIAINASLYIRDSEFNALVMKVFKVSISKNKTEAFPRALENELQRLTDDRSLTERIAEIQLRIQNRIGENQPLHDHKAFMDEGWEL